MGERVNSIYDEYWPSISADGQKLVYTVLVPRDTLAFKNRDLQKNALNFREDFYTSEYVDSIWTVRDAVSSINTDGNEGAQTLSADGIGCSLLPVVVRMVKEVVICIFQKNEGWMVYSG